VVLPVSDHGALSQWSSNGVPSAIDGRRKTYDSRTIRNFRVVSDFERSPPFYEDLLGLTVGWLNEDRRTVLMVGPPVTRVGIVERAPKNCYRHHFSVEIALDI